MLNQSIFYIFRLANINRIRTIIFFTEQEIHARLGYVFAAAGGYLDAGNFNSLAVPI